MSIQIEGKVLSISETILNIVRCAESNGEFRHAIKVCPRIPESDAGVLRWLKNVKALYSLHHKNDGVCETFKRFIKLYQENTGPWQLALSEFYFEKQYKDTLAALDKYAYPEVEEINFEEVLGKELHSALINHDWYYPFSDSMNVYKAGERREENILKLIGGDKELKAIAFKYAEAQGTHAAINFLK